jgi:HEAT repeat protein
MPPKPWLRVAPALLAACSNGPAINDCPSASSLSASSVSASAAPRAGTAADLAALVDAVASQRPARAEYAFGRDAFVRLTDAASPDALVALLADPRPEIRALVGRHIALEVRSKLDALRAVVGDEAKVQMLHYDIGSTATVGEEIVDAICDMANAPDPPAAALIVELAGSSGAASPAALRCLRQTFESERSREGMALYEAVDRHPVEKACAWLADGILFDERARASAASALGGCAGEAATEALAKLQRDPSANVRTAAGDAIARRSKR